MNHPILIRRLTGTNKGKDEHFHTQEVSFGTGPNNTVRFDPTWDRGVSSSHARLYRDAEGVWWLADVGSSTGTHLNGQKLTQPRALVGNFVIELGQNGPRVEVTLPADALAARDQRPSGPAHLGQGGGGRGPARKGNKLPIAIAALVALGLGVLWMLRPGGGSINVNLGGGDSDQKIVAAARKYELAVGKVVNINSDGSLGSSGTAWAVGPNLFATNGHISQPAKVLLEQGGAVFIAMNKQPDKKLRVVDAITHPEYGKRNGRLNAQGKQAEIPPYDVGLLVTKESSPIAFNLGSDEKIAQLDSGHRIAFIGFPAERLANRGSDNVLPVATMQMGNITSVTDYWGSHADAANSQLVQHNLPSAGGASGSPIFDADGDVVAVNNAVNFFWLVNSSSVEAHEEILEQAPRLLVGIIKNLGLVIIDNQPVTSDRWALLSAQEFRLAASKLDELIAVTDKKRAAEIDQIKKDLTIPGSQNELSAIIRAKSILSDLVEREEAAKGNLNDAQKDLALLQAFARYKQLLETKVSMNDMNYNRVPSAALINFAMRVDVLKELLDTYQESVKKVGAQ